MHKLMSLPITLDSFEQDESKNFKDNIVVPYADSPSTIFYFSGMQNSIIDYCESLRLEYLHVNEQLKNVKTDEERQALSEREYCIWKTLVSWLPSGWLQKRTVTLNYENLLSICSKSQRRFHKLNEWSGRKDPSCENFISWARTLPYAQEFIFFDELSPVNKPKTKEENISALIEQLAKTANIPISVLNEICKSKN